MIQLHGKELSFNNINDSNGALDMLKIFKKIPFKFFKYLKYRTYGLILTHIGLFLTNPSWLWVIISMLSIEHNYNIYKKEDGGTNHLQLMNEIKNLKLKIEQLEEIHQSQIQTHKLLNLILEKI